MSDTDTLIDQIDGLLPQTQCRECGYDSCRAYAEAMVKNNDTIDKCTPGGVNVLYQLAATLKRDSQPWLAKVKAQTRAPATAVIREAECIGCTKCIQACPVDAIIGSAKQMHAILQQECTGCGLCVEPCPMDCIDILPIEKPTYQVVKARDRFVARQLRLNMQQQHRKLHYQSKPTLNAKTAAEMQDEISKACERAANKNLKNEQH